MNQQQADSLVRAALEAMQISWRQKGDGICLCTEVRKKAVPVVLRTQGERLTLYALLPVQGDSNRLALACNAINRVLGDGCLVADEKGCALLKQTVYLTDALYAAQTIERALGRQRYLLNQCIGALEKEML